MAFAPTFSEIPGERKQQFLAYVAEAFGWKPGDENQPYDPRFFTPPDMQEAFREAWNMADASKLSPRQQVERRIYNQATTESKIEALRRHDPRIMAMVDAMTDEYLLCEYWQMQLMDGNPDHDKRGDRMAAINAVRSHIGLHYIHELLEQGYSKNDAVKIVGNAVGGFSQTMESSMGRKVLILPIKKPDETPETVVNNIEHQAQRSLDNLISLRGRS